MRLRFGYRSREGEDTRRHVEPHSLVHLGPRWYLVAWDCGREDWRTFRLDRIVGVPAPGERFTPAGAAGRRSRRLRGPEPSRGGVPLPRAGHAAGPGARGRRPPPVDAGAPRADRRGPCLYTASDDSLEWLALRIGFLGVPFEVHEPPELREWCSALADRFGLAAAGG